MSQYWSPIVHNLHPYVPGEQPQDRSYIKLNTNENPYPPAPEVQQVLRDYDFERLKLYPDPQSLKLREALAEYHGVSIDQVFVGNGSDEVLAHAFRAFYQQPRALLFPNISYSFYPVYCELFEIDYQTIALDDDFSISPRDYKRRNGGIILPNPNAPTGRVLGLEAIAQLAEAAQGVCLVDEAYIDFGGESAISLLPEYDNLLITRTFSKSRSMAGLRLGYAIGSPALIEGLVRIKDSFNSYPVDSLASLAGITSLQQQDYFAASCQRIIDTREQSVSQMQALGFEVIPSASNFVFAHHPEFAAATLYQQLKEHGILVRFFNKPRISDYLRITIGTDAEMQALIAALEKIVGAAES